MGLAQSLRSGKGAEGAEDNRPHPEVLPPGSHGYRAPPEIQVLRHHSNIVRHLEVLSDGLLASGSDDATVVVWDTYTGSLKHVLVGHDRRYNVTCLLHIMASKMLASGSSDRTIKLWNYMDGVCIKTLADFHDGSVVCLQLLPNGFCSGANDNLLGVWSPTGEEVGKIIRKEEENIHCLLPISGDRVVTGSNSSLILVYSLTLFKFIRLLAAHRESVRCLTAIDDTRFASASMDGLIVVWSDELAPLKTFNFHNNWFDKQLRAYLFPVWDMCVMSPYIIAAAVGNGFIVYNLNTAQVIAMRKNAHKTAVVKILCLGDGTRLCTCAADGAIRVWALDLGPESGSSPTSESTSKKKSRRQSDAMPAPTTTVCVANLTAHTDGVSSLVALGSNSFASCGSDALVILWKDGDAQTDLRTRFAAMALMYENAIPRRPYLETFVPIPAPSILHRNTSTTSHEQDLTQSSPPRSVAGVQSAGNITNTSSDGEGTNLRQPVPGGNRSTRSRKKGRRRSSGNTRQQATVAAAAAASQTTTTTTNATNTTGSPLSRRRHNPPRTDTSDTASRNTEGATIQ